MAVNHVLGKRDPAGDPVAVDGKELLSSQGMKIASAYSVKDGRWLGSEAVAPGSNEIPVVQELLRRTDIEGSLITAAAAAFPFAQQMIETDRSYWGIETGLHLRLDVTAGEDRSRVRHRTSALNLAMIRIRQVNRL
jgi:predicted transposase YbfD/YdcC